MDVVDLAGKVSYLKAGEDYIAELEEVLGAGRVKFAGPNNGRNRK